MFFGPYGGHDVPKMADVFVIGFLCLDVERESELCLGAFSGPSDDHIILDPGEQAFLAS